jgi:hypothetical protein
MLAEQNALTAAYGEVFAQTGPIRGRLQIAQSRLDELERKPLAAPEFTRNRDGGYSYVPPGERREQALKEARDKTIAGARQERDTMQQELDRLSREGDSLKSRMSPVPSRCVQWIRSIPPEVQIELHTGKIHAPQGEPLVVVAALRQKLQDLADERNRPLRYPAATTQAIVRRFVEGLASRGQPNFQPTIDEARDPALPASNHTLLTGEVIPGVDVAAFLAWAAKDRLLDVMLAALADATKGDDRPALDQKQRATREAELLGQSLELQRQEEQSIVEAEQIGIEIGRRPDVDCRAVLGLSSQLPAPR